MKKLVTLYIAIVIISLTSFGQVPEGFKYQAVIRDADNTVLTSQAIGIQLTIIQGSVDGTAIYAETFASITNTYGLVNLEIGTGTTSDDFEAIEWENGPYFIETSVDTTGGLDYLVMGTSQLMSVPYALYAKSSGSSIPGPQGLAGINGAMGEMGPQGPAGANGVDGAIGEQGLQGASGATGEMGPPGLVGADGATGETGSQGVAGADGAMGAQGSAGADGADGSTGETGAEGLAGADGEDGADGATGAHGLTGADGTDGVDGAVGATGLQGLAGADGADGADGVDGAVGATGLQGLAGADGATGADGADGVTGAQGLAGADGADGATGAQGLAGADGADGATGSQGVAGADGADGADGATGAQGVAGADGTDGVDGATGAQGSTGPQGTAGSGSGIWSEISADYNQIDFTGSKDAQIKGNGTTDLSGNDFGLGDGIFWGCNPGEDTGMFTDGDQLLFISPGDNQLVQFWEEDGHQLVAQISGSGAYSQVSDESLKQNIQLIENAIEKTQSLAGYTYELKQCEEDVKKQTPVELGMGILAQELKEVAPRLVTRTEQGHYVVNYDGIIPILIEATKEQQDIITAQQAQIDKLRIEMEAIKLLLSK